MTAPRDTRVDPGVEVRHEPDVHVRIQDVVGVHIARGIQDIPKQGKLTRRIKNTKILQRTGQVPGRLEPRWNCPIILGKVCGKKTDIDAAHVTRATHRLESEFLSNVELLPLGQRHRIDDVHVTPTHLHAPCGYTRQSTRRGLARCERIPGATSCRSGIPCTPRMRSRLHPKIQDRRRSHS